MKALLAVLALLVLAGCGGGSSSGGKQPLSSADFQHLHRFSVDYEQVVTGLVPISEAVVDQNLSQARTGMDTLKPKLAATLAEAGAVQHPATHKTLGEVSGAAAKMTTSVDKLLTTLEAHKEPDLDLISGVSDATTAMQRANDLFEKNVLAGAPEEQQEAIRAAIYTRR